MELLDQPELWRRRECGPTGSNVVVYQRDSKIVDISKFRRRIFAYRNERMSSTRGRSVILT